MLKQASALGLNLATLQRSEDGVHFTDVPGGVAVFSSVGTLKFPRVTSRFVWVEIRNLVGGGNALEELAVFPE